MIIIRHDTENGMTVPARLDVAREAMAGPGTRPHCLMSFTKIYPVPGCAAPGPGPGLGPSPGHPFAKPFLYTNLMWAQRFLFTASCMEGRCVSFGGAQEP